MTPQEVFNTVATHLFEQGEMAYDGSKESCMYRTDDGLKCAVGCLVPDETYSLGMEYQGVFRLIDNAEDRGYSLPSSVTETFSTNSRTFTMTTYRGTPQSPCATPCAPSPRITPSTPVSSTPCHSPTARETQPMATCTTEKAEVTYVLRLSAREAQVLYDLLNHVGGEPKGPRGCADSIRRALLDAGVKNSLVIHQLQLADGSVRLPDTFPSDYP